MAQNIIRSQGGVQVAGLPPVEAPAPDISARLSSSLCAVDLLVRRPSGRLQAKNVEVTADDNAGKRETLDREKITTPCFIIDTKADAEFWFMIDENTRLFESTLRSYSVNDARRGFHLVTMAKSGNMVAKFSELRSQRKALVQQFCDHEYDNWIANLERKFNGHFYLLKPRLPSRDQLLERFDATWTRHPLTPLDPANMRFSDITEDEQARIIAESNAMSQQLVENRAKLIFEEVFGSVNTKCAEIAAGALESGKRKFGAITELVEVLERLRNFSEFANPEIIQHANATLGLLREVTDISVVNANEGQNVVSAAIKTAVLPLGTAIQAMMAGNQRSRSRRSIEG